jgi:hypothetical protein
MKLRTFLKLALFILPLAFFSTKPVPLANAGILEIDAGASDEEMRKMTPKELLKAIEKMDPSDVEQLPWDVRDKIREALNSPQEDGENEKSEEPKSEGPEGINETNAVAPDNLNQPIIFTIPFSNADNLPTFKRVSDIVKKDGKKIPEMKPRRLPGEIIHGRAGRDSRWPNGMPVQQPKGGGAIGADYFSAIVPDPAPSIYVTIPDVNLFDSPLSFHAQKGTEPSVPNIKIRVGKVIYPPGELPHNPLGKINTRFPETDRNPPSGDMPEETPFFESRSVAKFKWASSETPKGDIRILTPNIDFVKAIIYLATTLKSHNSQEMAIPLILGALTGGYLSAMGIPANIAQAQPEFAILTDNNYWSELSKPKPDDATIRNLTVLHGKYCCTELDKVDVAGTPNSVVECVPGSQE